QAAAQGLALELPHRRWGEVVQELLLLLPDLRLPWPERPLAHLRVEVRPPGVRGRSPLQPGLHAAHRPVVGSLPGPDARSVPQGDPRRGHLPALSRRITAENVTGRSPP